MSTLARAWWSLSTVVVVVAFVVQVPITAANETGFFDSPAARVANLFSFFTILTNLLVGITSATLAIRPEARGTLFRVLRLDAVLGITVTGIVFHTLLAGLRELHGAELFADHLFHTVSPIMVVAGWLMFGPRGLIDGRAVGYAVIYPLGWLAFTLVRGAVIGWYPYPFVDVSVLGYGTVVLNCVGITLLFVLLAAGAMVLDGLLARRAERMVP